MPHGIRINKMETYMSPGEKKFIGETCSDSLKTFI